MINAIERWVKYARITGKIERADTVRVLNALTSLLRGIAWTEDPEHVVRLQPRAALAGAWRALGLGGEIFEDAESRLGPSIASPSESAAKAMPSPSVARSGNDRGHVTDDPKGIAADAVERLGRAQDSGEVTRPRLATGENSEASRGRRRREE